MPKPEEVKAEVQMSSDTCIFRVGAEVLRLKDNALILDASFGEGLLTLAEALELQRQAIPAVSGFLTERLNKQTAKFKAQGRA